MDPAAIAWMLRIREIEVGSARGQGSTGGCTGLTAGWDFAWGGCGGGEGGLEGEGEGTADRPQASPKPLSLQALAKPVSSFCAPLTQTDPAEQPQGGAAGAA